MTDIRIDRVRAMADWMETIPPQPPFYEHPDFKQFSDLSDLEIEAVERAMRIRGEIARVDAAKFQLEQSKRARKRLGIVGVSGGRDD
ncbi:hypothetical protein EBBID32_1080 [Sphingobium indicum BiD32]|uniref:Uncharacterized protein n=1 Tax=Sphingobium indicum BiD32 TaxID=1301087 RepID=N1MEY7_9SPHN|nr:hypothetical protein [Sphingobium indicum]CCW15780.1 hypothetical protein EBBID32_1080 [Sphingobium indicum BiD32]